MGDCSENVHINVHYPLAPTNNKQTFLQRVLCGTTCIVWFLSDLNQTEVCYLYVKELVLLL